MKMSKRHPDEELKLHDRTESDGSKFRNPSPTPEPKPSDAKKRKGSTPKKVVGIQLKLAEKKKEKEAVRTKVAVAAVFDQESDEEVEEMPPEARMRMRNIGRDTPTSAGPNSFGKTKHGFCDSNKVFEKNMKDALNSVKE